MKTDEELIRIFKTMKTVMDSKGITVFDEAIRMLIADVVNEKTELELRAVIQTLPLDELVRMVKLSKRVESETPATDIPAPKKRGRPKKNSEVLQ